MNQKLYMSLAVLSFILFQCIPYIGDLILFIIIPIGVFNVFHAKDLEYKWLSVISLINSILYVLTSSNVESAFVGYILSVISFIFTYSHLRGFKYILAGFVGFWILIAFYRAQWWSCPSVALTIFSLSCIFYTFSNILGFKVIIPSYLVLLNILRIASDYFIKYRFDDISMGDVFLLNTLFGVIGEYKMQLGNSDITIIAITLIIIILFEIAVWGNKYHIRSTGWGVYIIGLFIITSMLFANRTEKMLPLGEKIYQKNFYESLVFSTVREMKINTIKYDKEKIEGDIREYEVGSGEYEELKDINIVTVMCESYADIEDVYDVTLSRDPMSEFNKLNGENMQKGYVKVDTIGGGTVMSEWEYLTGLDIGEINGSQAVFTSIKHDYSFTSDAIYDNYRKIFLHPLRSVGYDRKTVYKNLNYDELLFFNNAADEQKWGNPEYVRNFMSDESVYEKIQKELIGQDEPQFIMSVTIQNHGDYNELNVPDKIKVKEDIQNKDKIENYVTLVEMSSRAIANFVDWLREHPEEKTLLIFFGDHQPGGFGTVNGDKFYKTPYLVYSNFCDLDDMPDNLELNKLYPSAKRAAGIRLNAYENYILHEDVSKEFIAWRMKEKQK